jgi:hypothetical protein
MLDILVGTMEIFQKKENSFIFFTPLKIPKDYEEIYSKMIKGLFFGMVKATPQNSKFSIKVLERISSFLIIIYCIGNSDSK